MSEFPESDLRGLGIDGLTLGTTESVHVRTDGRGHGFQQREVPPASLDGLDAGGQFEFDPTNLSSPQRVDLRVKTCRSNPWLLQVSEILGRPLAAACPTSASVERKWLRYDDEDPATIYLELQPKQCVRVEHPDGSGIAILRVPDGFVVVDFHLPTRPIERLSALRAPLAEWAGRVADDWLKSELRDRAATSDTWSHVVGAGLHARFARGGDASSSHGIARLLAGEVDAELLVSRRWVRSLGLAELETIEDLSLVVADRIGRRIDGLHAEFAPRETWWLDDLVAACVERDDIEGVRILLVEAGVGDRIESALSALDERGRRFVAALPVIVDLRDERLSRSGLLPGAWWAELARS